MSAETLKKCRIYFDCYFELTGVRKNLSFTFLSSLYGKLSNSEYESHVSIEDNKNEDIWFDFSVIKTVNSSGN